MRTKCRIPALLAGIGLCVVLSAASIAWTASRSDAPTPRSQATFVALLERVRTSSADNADLPTLRAELDHQAGQRDAHLSGLYWHTNLAEAMTEAALTSRPILSLRLLGRLDEEYSCANSRFFRAILYSDPQIAKVLREKYVLHWESVREVPIITIDFGDGRTLKRTITGNSIHYVLTPDGRVIDALPGLIAPRLFEREVQRLGETFAGTTFDAAKVADYQAGVVRAAREFPTFTPAELALPEATTLRLAMSMADLKPQAAARPAAARAAAIAFSKGVIERPLIRSVQNPLPLLAEDTRLNLSQLRPTILAWLASPPTDLKTLNNRVYRDLFLTPLDDPMMGLDVPDAFSGLTAAVR